MAKYSLTKTCLKCGFSQTRAVDVYGDFDGWDDGERVLDPRACPVCVRTDFLNKQVEDLTKQLEYQTSRANANWRALCKCRGEEE